MNASILAKLIRKLARDHNKKIFTLRELAILGNENIPSVGMALCRAEKSGLVGHIRDLWINMLDMPTPEDVALAIKPLSYISFESALYKHGVLSQSPRGLLSLATASRPAKLSTPLGDMQFIHLSDKLFFGFDENRLATAEKAFLDMIYIRIRRGIRGTSEVYYADMLNGRRLSLLAKKFPPYIKGALAEYLEN